MGWDETRCFFGNCDAYITREASERNRSLLCNAVRARGSFSSVSNGLVAESRAKDSEVNDQPDSQCVAEEDRFIQCTPAGLPALVNLAISELASFEHFRFHDDRLLNLRKFKRMSYKNRVLGHTCTYDAQT